MSSRVDFRNIDSDTEENDYYRKVVHTIPGKFQLVLMSLEPGEDIKDEVHPKTVQFIRVEEGEGIATIGKKKYKLDDDHSITIPPGKHHSIRNASNSKPFKFYTIYTPPVHPPNRRNRRQPKTE